MLDTSNKENFIIDRLDGRHVTFHFCQKYAKKGDRRIKTETDTQPRIIRGSKITLIPKGKPLQQQHKKQNKQHRKMSNFEILKRKISYLETQQFLGDKSQRMNRGGQCNPEVDYIVTGEFGYSKRISVLEKYRQNIKNLRKDHEKRKASLNLIIKAQGIDSDCKLAPQFPPSTHIDTEPSQWLIKKRQIVSQCAKRYYRPQTLNRSKQALYSGQSVAQVKGRRVQHSTHAISGTSRCHRSTINFY